MPSPHEFSYTRPERYLVASAASGGSTLFHSRPQRREGGRRELVNPPRPPSPLARCVLWPPRSPPSVVPAAGTAAHSRRSLIVVAELGRRRRCRRRWRHWRGCCRARVHRPMQPPPPPRAPAQPTARLSGVPCGLWGKRALGGWARWPKMEWASGQRLCVVVFCSRGPPPRRRSGYEQLPHRVYCTTLHIHVVLKTCLEEQ